MSVCICQRPRVRLRGEAVASKDCDEVFLYILVLIGLIAKHHGNYKNPFLRQLQVHEFMGL